MILLISPYQNAPECATQFQRATRDKVNLVTSIPLALASLRQNEYSVVVVDENLLESTPKSTESLIQRMAGASLLTVDLACLRPEKATHLVVRCLQRRQLEISTARRQALEDLRSELKSDITGLLISSQMTLKINNLPPSTVEQLTNVLEIANRLKARLEL